MVGEEKNWNEEAQLDEDGADRNYDEGYVCQEAEVKELVYSPKDPTDNWRTGGCFWLLFRNDLQGVWYRRLGNLQRKRRS